MVTRKTVGSLIQVVWDLNYILERSRSATMISIQNIQVKGQNLILDALNRSFIILSGLSITELASIQENIRQWVLYLNGKYSDKFEILSGIPFYLSNEDAKRLNEAAQSWLLLLLNSFSKEGTVFIREDNVLQIFPEDTLNKLDSVTRSDLIDGIICILNLIPTPAVMILLRVGEGVVRKYYNKITGNSINRVPFTNIINELEKRNDKLAGYLSYIKQKRDEAEHPDKRFTQEEAERTLIHLKELIDAIKSKL